ncbi:sentrin-specific protease 2-like [Trichogramma pretiosum]|uniref:sentrin-specific protease 2-like n=1 Tax=Trichogramma pretiosum TaxID=7493 RepID=UPI000C71BD84|nr:sentrin-specific protease 2-like [Trichogramma pretiosum]
MNSDENQAMEEELAVNNATNLKSNNKRSKKSMCLSVDDSNQLEFKSNYNDLDEESVPTTEKKLKLEIVDMNSKYENMELTMENLISIYNTYPANFPNICNNINGIEVNSESFARLAPYTCTDQWLNDAIINAFMSLPPEIALKSKVNLCVFDTLFCYDILQHNSISNGFKKWGQKQKITHKNLWLIPVSTGNHWALLVVSLDQNIMMYLDSLHYSPSETLLRHVHWFMNYCTPKRQQKKNSEKVWTYYSAIDIPKQVDDNCGVYVCAWALTIASSSITAFGETDMNNIRLRSFLWVTAHLSYSLENPSKPFRMVCIDLEEFVMHCVSLQGT